MKILLKVLVVVYIFFLIQTNYCISINKKDVRIGYVEFEDTYNVDMEWGNLIYNFVQKELEDGQTYYDWEISELGEDSISITNYSNVVVNTDIQFSSNIASVSGVMNQEMSSSSSRLYSVLATEPEDFSIGTYYERTENNGFNLIPEGTIFETNKYYKIYGAGGGPYPESGDIPACTEEDGTYSCSGITYVLELLGGQLSDLRPGATVGVVTLTLS